MPQFALYLTISCLSLHQSWDYKLSVNWDTVLSQNHQSYRQRKIYNETKETKLQSVTYRGPFWRPGEGLSNVFTSFFGFFTCHERYSYMVFLKWTSKTVWASVFTKPGITLSIDSAVLHMMTYICPSTSPHLLQILPQPVLDLRRLSCTNHFKVPMPPGFCWI